MNSTDAIVKVITFCFAFGSPIAAALVWGLDRNKKWKEIKIAEAKEKSTGAQALADYKKEGNERFEQFKDDVFEIMKIIKPQSLKE